MNLDLTTFILEIVNFAILLWLLQRFLYRPVMDVISRRQEMVKKTMADAEATREQASTLQAQFENRLADWEREKERSRAALQETLEAEADRQRQALKQELQAEREKHSAREQRRLQEIRHQGEREALAQGARFATRILSEVAGPELEAKLVMFLLQELRQLPADRVQELQRGLQEEEPLQVLSAYTLDAEQRAALRRVLSGLAGGDRVIDFVEVPELVAGLRIQSDTWTFGANLQDELQAFADHLNHEN